MPFYEECLHCGAAVRLSLSTIHQIPESKRDKHYFIEPCLKCGVENAPHFRWFAGVERVHFKCGETPEKDL